MSLWLVTLCFVTAGFSSFATNYDWKGVVSDSSFSCNDLVQVSLDEYCEAHLVPDMILEGYDGDPDEFTMKVLDVVGLPIQMPINEVYIGDTLYLILNHNLSSGSCWGRVLIEDKWAPSLVCSNYFARCFDNPASFPGPVATDNCSNPTAVHLLSQFIANDDKCNEVRFTNTYIAVDDSGNESVPCTQIITLTPPALPNFPNDTIWSCETYGNHPNIILPTKLTGSLSSTGSGVPDVAGGNYCPFNITHSDFIINSDCGNTFTIVRTWTVLNWCTDEVVTVGADGLDNVQYIKVRDQNPPVLVRPPFTVNANIGSASNEQCGSIDYLLPPQIIDDCNAVTVRILTGIGEAIYINGDGRQGGFIPSPGLPIGVHTILYEAIDACHNVDTVQVQVTVADQTAPTPICDELTSVSLGIQGETAVLAGVFDDGSYDNCCLDGFKVRRMESLCWPIDTLFQDSIILCCSDVGDTVQVVMQVSDCAGNTNECMVLIKVEEKLAPYLVSCPASQTMSCDDYANFFETPLANGQDTVLDQFGTPEFADNCNLIFLEQSVNINLDQCLQGPITRRWRVTDPGHNAVVSCTQVLNVVHESDWLVSFPADQLISCGETFPDTGEPQIFYESCEMIAISFADEVFTIVPDVCLKIARTWTVINWCAVGDVVGNTVVESSEKELNFDLNNDNILSDRLFKDGLNIANFSEQLTNFGAQPDGIVVFQQEISIIDQVPPVVSCPPVLEVCITDTSCFADIELPLPDILDCTSETDISAIGDLGVGLGPFTNVPPGLYDMTYQVDDNCGNRGFCAFEIEVRDCKKPTPKCKNGLIIEMEEDSIIIVNAEIFDSGSFDNCPGGLTFSFSIDPSDSLAVFDCSSLGYQEVNIWLTDSAGNQDFCANFVFVEDNNGVCSGLPLVSGHIQTINYEGVNGVSVASNNQPATITDEDGAFSFLAATGVDLTITAIKEAFPLNGVTTYDLVLINKHILGVEYLDHPYKIIAADANLSNTVTTFDLVVLRKMILLVNDQFPHGKSWRFFDAGHSFPNELNPFENPAPELINFNNVGGNLENANLTAVKIGDVNFSANPSQ